MIPPMRTATVIPLATLAVLLAPSLRAGRAQSTAPTAVVDSFFRAVEQERWRDAARLMDLATFGALRDEEVRNMRRARAQRHPVTPDMLMKSDPRMPRAVAEYQAARTNEAMDQSDRHMHDYAGVDDVDGLAALSPDEAAARWLEAKDPRYMMRQSLAEARTRCNVPDSVIAQLVPLPATMNRVLGTVMDDSLAYVLYTELPSPGHDPGSPSAHGRRRARTSHPFWVMPPPVITLRRIGGQWRIAPAMPFGSMGGYASFIDCEPKGSAGNPARSP
jgi:hypothetical protein